MILTSTCNGAGRGNGDQPGDQSLPFLFFFLKKMSNAKRENYFLSCFWSTFSPASRPIFYLFFSWQVKDTLKNAVMSIFGALITL